MNTRLVILGKQKSFADAEGRVSIYRFRKISRGLLFKEQRFGRLLHLYFKIHYLSEEEQDTFE